LLRDPLKVTRRETGPSGALEGIIALIWPDVRAIGMALTVVLP
jgi:hypothetical protein